MLGMEGSYLISELSMLRVSDWVSGLSPTSLSVVVTRDCPDLAV